MLAAAGAYHGSAPWCTVRMDGVTPGDRANLVYYTFNDIASVHRALDEAGGEVAAIIVSPFKHDAGFDQELVDPAFARGLRELCTRYGTLLVLDETHTQFDVYGGAVTHFGVAPDIVTGGWARRRCAAPRPGSVSLWSASACISRTR